MKIGVVLASYNGARLIAKQLHSSAAQARPLDELTIVDDHSSDETVEIVRRFATRSGFPVTIAGE